MIDPAPENAREQTGPLVRPYIPFGGQYGTEGDRFWSEDLDDVAVSSRSAAPDIPSGDLLSEEWIPEPGADPLGEGDGTAEALAHPGDPGDLYDSGDPGDSGDHGDQVEPGDDPDSRWQGWRDHEDGATEPGGFLGAGWRGQDDPEEVEQTKRKSALLRAGAVAVAVVGAIWALTAWVGQPSGSACPPGTDCAAKAPATSPTIPVESVANPVAPAEPVPTEAITPGPTASRVVGPHTAAPSPRATASRRPSPKAPTTGPPVVSAEPSEPPVQPSSPAPTQPAPTQPTSAPAPTPPSRRHDGGLFGWLF